MSNLYEDGLTVFRQVRPDVIVPDTKQGPTGEFAGELGDIAMELAWGALWARPGLDPRSRSLVTLGISIALRASDELRIHFPIAARNGLTRTELEEVVYHAAGYAGFPAAGTAMQVAREVFDAIDGGSD
jgi:4-carboxymuconolactone decarboxylase